MQRQLTVEDDMSIDDLPLDDPAILQFWRVLDRVQGDGVSPAMRAARKRESDQSTSKRNNCYRHPLYRRSKRTRSCTDPDAPPGVALAAATVRRHEY